MTQIIEKYYRMLARISSSLQSPFLLAVRLYWGWQFMQTGWGKLTDIGKVVNFFTSLGARRSCRSSPIRTNSQEQLPTPF